jgi:hypothetical protein
MKVRLDGKAGNPVPPPRQLIEQIASQLRSEQEAWLRQLTEDPGRLADLEVSIHKTFQQSAAQLVASLLAQASQHSPALEAAQKK